METATTNMRTDFNNKLLSFQRELGGVAKKGTNPHFRSTYATLNDVLEATKGVLNKNDLFLLQPTGRDSLGDFVETRIQDSAGIHVNSVFYLPSDDGNIQKRGANITYARRFTLMSLLALEAEDDDGESSAGRGPTPKVRQSAAPLPLVGSSQGGGPNVGNRETLLKLLDVKVRVVLTKNLASKDDLVGYMTKVGAVKREDLTTDQVRTMVDYLDALINGANNAK